MGAEWEVLLWVQNGKSCYGCRMGSLVRGAEWEVLLWVQNGKFC